MALPASGQISFSDINIELGFAATAQISLGDEAVRSLFATPSGAIAMTNGYGKSNQFAFTIASNQTNADLYTLAINAGWDQTSSVEATIDSGVYISSTSTGTPALTVSGSFPSGVSLINNGYIIGKGGNGGGGAASAAATAAGVGGLALSVSVPISISNNNIIGGGGGGGGGGASRVGTNGCGFQVKAAGGGGGGGMSGTSNSSGGARGSGCGWALGANGGAGTSSAAGGGGNGGTTTGITGGKGGAGGSWGANGSAGAAGTGGTLSRASSGGGAAGAAVSGNSNITWVTTGTRYGAIA